MLNHQQISGKAAGAVLISVSLSFIHSWLAVKSYIYTDGLMKIAQDPPVDVAVIQLQNYLSQLKEWLNTNNM